MWNDAWNELEELAPETRHRPQVILMRVMIYNNLERWEEAAIIGKGALRHYPDFGALYVATALALRHHSGPAGARAVIVAGEPHFERGGVFPLHARLLRFRPWESGRCERRARQGF
jgi:hypothetical protein